MNARTGWPTAVPMTITLALGVAVLALAGFARLGTRPLAELLAPAIAQAEDGFPVSEIIAADWQSSAGELARIPSSAECFLPGGHAPKAGDVFRNPALARSLRRIATDGPGAFYRGPIAETVVA